MDERDLALFAFDVAFGDQAGDSTVHRLVNSAGAAARRGHPLEEVDYNSIGRIASYVTNLYPYVHHCYLLSGSTKLIRGLTNISNQIILESDNSAQWRRCNHGQCRYGLYLERDGLVQRGRVLSVRSP